MSTKWTFIGALLWAAAGAVWLAAAWVRPEPVPAIIAAFCLLFAVACWPTRDFD